MESISLNENLELFDDLVLIYYLQVSNKLFLLKFVINKNLIGLDLGILQTSPKVLIDETIDHQTSGRALLFSMGAMWWSSIELVSTASKFLHAQSCKEIFVTDLKTSRYFVEVKFLLEIRNLIWLFFR